MRHLGARLAWAIFVVWAVVSLAFLINNVIPSDPARMVTGPGARPADVERIRHQLGLDRPLLEQYARFITRLAHIGPSRQGDPEHTSCAAWGRVHVDLGKSYQKRRPVTEILAERLPRTLMLGGAAMVVQLALGVFSGVLAAWRKGTRTASGIGIATLLGISVPTFMLGLGLQYLMAHRLRLLPIDGFGQTAGEHAVSLLLPALTLGILGAAYYARLTRDEMIVLLQQDYVRTARAKGASSSRVAFVHALRNALLPIITVAALELGALVGGAVVIETLFRWPGIGSLSVTALLDRDGPVILGTVLITSVAIVAANVLADALYLVLDPRLRTKPQR